MAHQLSFTSKSLNTDVDAEFIREFDSYFRVLAALSQTELSKLSLEKRDHPDLVALSGKMNSICFRARESCLTGNWKS